MKLHDPAGNRLQRRPSESGTTVAAAIVAILTFYEVIPAELTWAFVLLVGAIPSGITWFVSRLKG